ncbi:DUF2188 domain-containing protein [Gracilibacillus salitolerans]|uniref:DUF2188 domain-containing protein n=1 Tax=Gracilibacillus salitolerans TaxID=2663022 RepID=A0A5Q2TLX3_9BACI|nr:DUF2188 domain-containing protein [Gracilibacillus salitolerans]QGH35151.1 DUF2188 domain-containing protein [Gracilibacillus salitolerans]
MAKTIHVIPHPNGGWQVKKGGSDKASSIHSTQQEAINAARATSQREGLELVIHRPDGRIRDKDSHGNDTYPPKG